VPEPLTMAQRNTMREVYLEHRTCEAVARLCECSWATAEKYRIEDEWDRACAKVDALAEKIAVEKVAKRRADSIRIAHAAIVKMAKDLHRKDVVDFGVGDFNTLVRLIEYLSGEADSTGELRFRDAKDVERFIKSLSDADLERAANEVDRRADSSGGD